MWCTPSVINQKIVWKIRINKVLSLQLHIIFYISNKKVKRVLEENRDILSIVKSIQPTKPKYNYKIKSPINFIKEYEESKNIFKIEKKKCCNRNSCKSCKELILMGEFEEYSQNVFLPKDRSLFPLSKITFIYKINSNTNHSNMKQSCSV